jgi:hypothetical protein
MSSLRKVLLFGALFSVVTSVAKVLGSIDELSDEVDPFDFIIAGGA